MAFLIKYNSRINHGFLSFTRPMPSWHMSLQDDWIITFLFLGYFKVLFWPLVKPWYMATCTWAKMWHHPNTICQDSLLFVRKGQKHKLGWKWGVHSTTFLHLAQKATVCHWALADLRTAHIKWWSMRLEDRTSNFIITKATRLQWEQLTLNLTNRGSKLFLYSYHCKTKLEENQ